MATGTKTPQDEDYYNRTQDLYNRELSGNHVAGQDQRDAFENEFGGDNYKKDADTSGSNTLANKAREQEESLDNYSGFYKYSGKKQNKKVVFNFKNLKKRSPVLAIIIGLLGGAIGIGGLASPALILVHIEENFVKKYDSQNTSMTIRANKLIAKKIAGDATSGSCTKVKILCKFTRPSSTLLKNLNKNGIQALGKDGKVIDPKSWVNPFPNDRPALYQFTDNSGKQTIIKAEDFSTQLNNNSEFRAAFHRAYNPRFIGYSDSVFKTIEARFGFKKSSSTADAKTADEVKDKVNNEGKGGSPEAKAAANGSTEVVEGTAKKLLNTQLTKMLDKLSKAGKGSGISMGIGVVCLATDLPGIITATARAFQMAQVVTYAYTFLNVASAIKAGDATPQQVAGLGGLLTTVVAGKSAMDSFGMKYSLFGDTKASSSSYKKLVPGGGVANNLGGLVKVTSSTAVKDSCNTATSPGAAGAINAALVLNSGETLGATAAIAALNIGLGFALQGIMSIVGPQIIDTGLSLIGPKAINDMMTGAFGDITKNLSGEDVGNALASGSSNMMGQTANAGGNMPLTVDDAVAYNNETQKVQLAYADEDRATLSPLDPNSSSTFIGSIVDKLIPYYGNITSAGGVLSSIASIATGSFSSLFQAHAAADPSAQYQLCDDPMLSGVAAGPFCNIQYGIPNQYLNEDPEDVVNYMLDNNYINGDTGSPTGDYADWLTLCGDGATDQANNCEIKDPQHANFALYTVDHRVQKTMDGEDDQSSASSTADATIDQAHIYDPSTDVACAAGTEDAGVSQGYNNGQEIDVRLCSIPGTINIDSSTPEVGQEAKVNSRASGAWLALMKALSQSRGGSTIQITDSFRSMADQQAARAQYGSGAAQPGYSNHQMGLAIDFQLPSGNSGSSRPGDPVWDWLSANAGMYGINQLSSEAWHWQPTGAHQ